jgi:hypothetical protein
LLGILVGPWPIGGDVSAPEDQKRHGVEQSGGSSSVAERIAAFVSPNAAIFGWR